ncbi:MAG: universal stress protein, partial [Chitinophagaceae bacterium]
DMALAINASLLLLHIYQIPVAVTDTPLVMVSVDDLKEDAEKKLDTARQELEHITSGKLKIYTEARLGNVTDELEEIGKKIQPFAIVMGTTGHSAMERVIFGSNTLSVIKHLTWPVICVPVGKEYGRGIKKIGLACDFREVAETVPSDAIKSFAAQFDAEFYVLNVQYQEPSAELPEQSALLQTSLQELKPNYRFIKHKDIEEGIHEFAEQNNLDMIITIPKKHKLLQGIFKKSSTKQLIYHSHIPVMSLHN